MRWLEKMSDNIRRGVRSWLQIQPANPYDIQIQEMMDFETNAIRNRIWYRGDGNELEQLYESLTEYADKYKFWASKSTPGMDMRKIHTGLPQLIVKVLTAIVLSDMNDFEFDSDKQEETWKSIEEQNHFRKKMEKALKEILYIGDGAFKVTIDTAVSEYPILEWYPGERIEIIYQRDRVHEVIFKTPYDVKGRRYVLNERYGYGYIINELYLDEKLVDLKVLEQTGDLTDWQFDRKIILAVPVYVYESAKYEGRGGSIYDGKLDSFDTFDEVWSQWMDAVRAGRARTYVPDCLVPKDPMTGEPMRPNPFDNRFFAGDNNMDEKGENKVQTDQPVIPHDSYLASYVTAQREKEKTTLYTRNAIVEAIQETLPKVVSAAVNAYNILIRQPVEEVKVDIPFGEYANPSFESQVETMAKARPGVALMSVEAQVEELYGDSRDEQWKQEEIARLKAEQGIAEIEEPGVNMAAGIFDVSLGGEGNAGQGNEPDVQNEPGRVPGTSGDSQ